MELATSVGGVEQSRAEEISTLCLFSSQSKDWKIGLATYYLKVESFCAHKDVVALTTAMDSQPIYQPCQANVRKSLRRNRFEKPLPGAVVVKYRPRPRRPFRLSRQLSRQHHPKHALPRRQRPSAPVVRPFPDHVMVTSHRCLCQRA